MLIAWAQRRNRAVVELEAYLTPARARQYAAMLEALKKIAHDETVSYLACPGPPNCDGSHYESCPVQIARAVLEVKP